MPRRPTPNRRLLASLVLATLLAGEVAGLAVAAREPSPSPAVETEPRAGYVAQARGGTPATPRSMRARVAAGSDDRPVRQPDPASVIPQRRFRPDHARPERHRASGARPDAPAEPRSVSTVVRPDVAPPSGSASAGPRTRSGRNHVWIPSLGISRSVEAFPCDRKRPPDNYVYRWGCAGRNNVYLLGHAHSVFKPLHDAYVNKRLRKGMTVDYADASGRVRTYAIVWWKVTPPTTSASWAWAAQARPSMTLQTCVGANNQYRLMVRLVAVD